MAIYREFSHKKWLSQDVTIKPPLMCGKASETLRRISQEIRPDDINKAGKRGIEAINLAMFTVENHGKISGESAKHMEFLFFVYWEYRRRR